ncbi:MAG: crotonase/enoyl-CoA hydratase family protein [Novosphingobium sp.]
MNIADRVTVTLEDGVAHVRLERPDKLNALDEAMFNAIVEAGQRLYETREARCVVLSGAGRGFSAGLDLSALESTGSEARVTDRTHGNCNRAQQSAMVWRKLPMPVIAAIHGICFGGGLHIASGACVRICAPDARLAVMELKWGLVPDMGGHALWRGNVRDDVLRELTYTHREFSGEDAVRWGFATHVDPDPVGRALALASEIALNSPHALHAAKALANRQHDCTVEQLLAAESHEQQRLIGSRNQREAVAAGIGQRPPAFVDA